MSLGMLSFVIAGCSMGESNSQTSEAGSPAVVWPHEGHVQNLRYNVSPGDGLDVAESLTGTRPTADPFRYYCSVSLPPTLTVLEAEQVKGELLDSVGEFLKQSGFPTHDVFGSENFDSGIFKYSGEIMGLFDPIDRTIETPVVDPEMFTPDYVRHVQSTVLQKFPLFRLEVVGTSREGEEGLYIYPEAVCVGSRQCPPGDLTAELSDWIRKTVAIREKSVGPRRRQLRHALDLARTRLPELKDSPDMLFLAASDNWRGESDTWSLWVLQPWRSTYGIESFERAGTGDSFQLDEEMRVVPNRTRKVTDWKLVQHTFPPQPDSEELEIEIEEFKGPRKVTFQLKRSEFLSDSQLKTLGYK